MVKDTPAGESKRTADPSAMSASGVLSDTRIFPARRLGRRGGNTYTPSGASTATTIEVSRPPIHQPRNVRLVGDLAPARFVLMTPTTTRAHYSPAPADARGS